MKIFKVGQIPGYNQELHFKKRFEGLEQSLYVKFL